MKSQKKPPRILKSGEQEEQFYERFWKTILKGNVMEGEVINKTKSGDLIHIEFSSNPIVDRDGNLLGFIAIQDDITEGKKKDNQIRQSLREKEVLLGEIHHRVKNNLAIVSGLLELNLYGVEDESVTNFVKSSQLRIKSMAKIHEKLYESETFSHVPFREYIEEMISEIQATISPDGFEPNFNLEIEPVILNINQAIPCGLILNELITNCLQHAFPGRKTGTTTILLKKENHRLHLCVEDDGVGIGNSFNLEEASTIGMTLIKISSMQLDADLDMQNSDKGFKCTISFEAKENVKGSSSGISE